MNPLLQVLLQSAIKYAFDLRERYIALNGKEPTYEEIWAQVEEEISKIISEGEAWKQTHPEK